MCLHSVSKKTSSFKFEVVASHKMIRGPCLLGLTLAALDNGVKNGLFQASKLRVKCQPRPRLHTVLLSSEIVIFQFDVRGSGNLVSEMAKSSFLTQLRAILIRNFQLKIRGKKQTITVESRHLLYIDGVGETMLLHIRNWCVFCLSRKLCLHSISSSFSSLCRSAFHRPNFRFYLSPKRPIIYMMLDHFRVKWWLWLVIMNSTISLIL